MDNDQSAVLSKGINFQELLSGGTEFQIDMNFANKNIDPLLRTASDLLYDEYEEDESPDSASENDEKDMYKDFTEQEDFIKCNKLLCPEYIDFKELSSIMTNCDDNGDVKIMILKEGDGPTVPHDALVTMHYAAYWEHIKEPFDVTVSRNNGEPLKYRLGVGKFLPGLEIGLTKVKGPAANFCLLLTPKVTWGEMGVLPKIKPETSLFIVNLLDVQDIGDVERFNCLPKEEQRKFDMTVKTVKASNAIAKELFQKKHYKKALRSYLKSLSVLQISETENEDEIKEIKLLLSTVYINLAVCYSKLRQPDKILSMCDELGHVTDTKNNPKCLYYYGKAFEMKGKTDKAMDFYKRAYKLSPKNADIGTAMANLDSVLNKSSNQERLLYKNMFNNKDSVKNDNFDDVDDNFKANMREYCDLLNGANRHTKFELSKGLLSRDLDYVRHMIKDFQNISFVEEKCGSGTKYMLMRKVVTIAQHETKKRL